MEPPFSIPDIIALILIIAAGAVGSLAIWLSFKPNKDSDVIITEDKKRDD